MNTSTITPTVTSVSQLLSPRETAKLLHTTYGSLAVWRSTRRKGLRFVRLGRKIFYRPEDIQEFIASQIDPGDGPKPEKFRKRQGRR